MIVGLGVGRGSPMQSVDADWLLRDEFVRDLAAGAVNGTDAEPGPGTRVVVDTNGVISITSGATKMNGTTAAGDRLVLPSVVRATGRMLVGEIAADTLHSTYNTENVGWSLGDTGTACYDGFEGVISGGSHLSARVANGNIGVFSCAFPFRFVLACRASGMFFFRQASGQWLLHYVSATGNTSPLYPKFVTTAANNKNWSLGFMRVPVALWLPTPLASDGFGSAFGTSDGAGHAEGIAGGIGAGGGGKTWSNAGGTWSVSGGKAINTPVPGSELLTNGDMETGDPPTSWNAVSCTADGVADERTGGSGSQSVVLTATSTGEPYISQGPFIFTPGTWVRLDGWVKQTVGSKGVKIRIRDNVVGGAFETVPTTSAAWTYVSVTARLVHNSNAVWCMFSNSASIGDTGHFDDLSLSVLTRAELLTVTDVLCANVFTSVAITRESSRLQAGLALNWDSVIDPQSGVIVYISTNIIVDKYVSGTVSQVSSTAYTYSAGARLVVAKSGTEYRVYYNNAFIVAVTISDASIINNTLHGLFSTDASNTLDDFTCYATGTGGEYAELDKWS